MNEMNTETHNTMINHTLGDNCAGQLRSIFNQHELLDADNQMKCLGFWSVIGPNPTDFSISYENYVRQFDLLLSIT